MCWQSVWVKKGAMQWWRDWKPHKWTDVHFALEQFSGPEGYKDGILFIYYNYYEEKKVYFIFQQLHTFQIYSRCFIHSLVCFQLFLLFPLALSICTPSSMR